MNSTCVCSPKEPIDGPDPDILTKLAPQLVLEFAEAQESQAETRVGSREGPRRISARKTEA